MKSKGGPADNPLKPLDKRWSESKKNYKDAVPGPYKPGAKGKKASGKLKADKGE